MKIRGILFVSSLLLQSTMAGLWGSSSNNGKKKKVMDPITAEKNLPSAPTSKYDYKLSFKKNYYYNGSIPFWTAGGDIFQSEDFIRLSPSVPNTKGWIWSEIPNPYEEWEVDVAFRVTGNHMQGGRGLALWYTQDKEQPGPIYGSKDKWDGLSVWLDSNNPVTHKPSTVVILNDGTLEFASKNALDPRKYMLGACSISFRNTENPVYLKVSLRETTLTVSMDNGSGAKDYRICVQKSGIKLPTGYYFGVSALSINPADDHDIISFETRQLNPPKKLEHPKRPLEDEKKKRGEEFTGIDEEQRKKIEEAEFQMRKLRETAENSAAIYDTQQRAIEHIQLVQLQIEALGAPSPDDAITGNYQKIDLSKINDMGSSSSNSASYDKVRAENRYRSILFVFPRKQIA
ncbi:legume-like lectin family-domain-containing protein [Mycotypha africana]|uniref:legume-like lectin family-domain-containing protein n=1 Tax=Mycotypha africana TaxID=64632 RepID=UPI0023008271|nr:legume-like lectin family-domain-containing protein [Mycotypha africana]KAI8973534.1 legume-like lectin family-domain-containing protein [Mycotypha africana]